LRRIRHHRHLFFNVVASTQSEKSRVSKFAKVECVGVRIEKGDERRRRNRRRNKKREARETERRPLSDERRQKMMKTKKQKTFFFLFPFVSHTRAQQEKEKHGKHWQSRF
jgi:hypothetical protein